MSEFNVDEKPRTPLDGGPAFPTNGPDNGVWGAGMTMRQYAAIKLRVPDSGTDWLDDMIRQSLRDEMGAKAMQEMLANSQQGYVSPTTRAQEEVVSGAYVMADAMLAAREL